MWLQSTWHHYWGQEPVVVPHRLCYFVPICPMGRDQDETKMPRKPSAIVQYKLRIRETLRRRIEQAAKQHGVSANQEMVSRLERSFELEEIRELGHVAGDMTTLLGRFEKCANDFSGLFRVASTFQAPVGDKQGPTNEGSH
jgi:hypothetical protein